MKNKFLTLYVVFVSLIYVFALSFFSINLFYEYSHGAERTKRRFEHFENVINKTNDQDEIIKAIGDLKDFAYLKISLSDNSIFIYPDSNSIQNPETKLLKNYSSNKKFQIEASLYTLRPSTIHYYSRITFLIIILVTTITLIIVFYIELKEGKSFVNIEEIDENNDEEILEELPDENAELEISNEIKSEENINNIVEEPKEEIASEDSNIEINNEDKDSSNNIENEPVLAQLPEDQAKPIECTEIKEDNLKSNEELLELRLEKEIERAISTEVDLSVFLIRIPELGKDTVQYQEIKSIIEKEFQYKDLIFEVNTDCIASIKLNTDLDEAIEFADSLNHLINNVISNDNLICYIGIASRTLRIVSAKRLIHESKEALVHAQEDSTNPIVGFKVDSDKYMKIIEK